MNNQRLIRLDDRPSPPPRRELPVLQRDFADNQDNQKDLGKFVSKWWAHRLQRWHRVDGVNVSIPTASCSSDTNPAWLARRQQNKTNSILYRLPEEILIKIRDSADPVTQTLMRWSCSLLLRIVADWDICPATRGAVALNKLTATLRFDDQLQSTRCTVLPFPGCATCTPCVEGRARRYMRGLATQGMLPVWPLPSNLANYSGAHLFQLRAIMDRDSTRRCRDCIASRGSPLFHSRKRDATAGQFCFDCKAYHGKHLFTQETSLGLSPHRLCIFQASSVHVNVCRHKKVSYQSQARAVGPYTAKCNSARFCDSEAHSQYTLPTILYSSKLAFQLDPGVPVTREHIQRFLAQTKEHPDSLGQFCPHVKPWDGRLMLPFLPDQCACFPDPPSTHYGANHTQDCICCRCQTTRADLENTVEQNGDNGRKQENHYRFITTVHSHRYKCNICEATYIWHREPERRDVYFASYRYAGRSFPCFDNRNRGQWLRLVDPGLWLTGKPEAKHILWCDSPGCETTRLWRNKFPGDCDAVSY